MLVCCKKFSALNSNCFQNSKWCGSNITRSNGCNCLWNGNCYIDGNCVLNQTGAPELGMCDTEFEYTSWTPLSFLEGKYCSIEGTCYMDQYYNKNDTCQVELNLPNFQVVQVCDSSVCKAKWSSATGCVKYRMDFLHFSVFDIKEPDHTQG